MRAGSCNPSERSPAPRGSLVSSSLSLAETVRTYPPRAVPSADVRPTQCGASARTHDSCRSRAPGKTKPWSFVVTRARAPRDRGRTRQRDSTRGYRGIDGKVHPIGCLTETPPGQCGEVYREICTDLVLIPRNLSYYDCDFELEENKSPNAHGAPHWPIRRQSWTFTSTLNRMALVPVVRALASGNFFFSIPAGAPPAHDATSPRVFGRWRRAGWRSSAPTCRAPVRSGSSFVPA
jgi:hypothetical protein